jgi:ectoine hydroxylase-related dioxygenase (phytanoyl-CoA dioxygenase family)
MHVTPEELRAGQLGDANMALAVRTLRDSGMVVLEEVYDPAWVADLRDAYDAQLERHIAAKGGMDGINQRSFGHSHIGMFLPMVEPFSNLQVVAHPLVVQLLDTVLGADFRCSFYHSNTSYPGSGVQPIHRDNQPLFGTELGVPHPAVSVVLNIPLCDFTEENGSTEVWPGTHLIVDAAPQDAKALEERVGNLASVRTNVRAGSLILRDLRTWHRGMPNNADYARSMLAIVYRRGWLHGSTATEIPRATWDSMPERVRQIFRDNPIVEDTPDLAGVTIGDLAAQGRLRR